MNKRLRALLEQKEKAVKDARAIMATADAAGRDLTEDEQSNYDALIASLDGLNAKIEAEKQLIEAERTLQGVSVDDEATISGGRARVEDDPRRGFQSYGDFVGAVVSASRNHRMDDRLLIGAAAPSTYANEGNGADGGFLVPPEFSREIFRLSLEDQAFLPLTDNTPVAGNSMAFPSDETTPWGSNGVRAFWEGEAEAATATKPVFKTNTMRLRKLMALVPVTDELVADAAAISSYLTGKTAESIRWKSNDALVHGDGVGKPLGVLNSAALVSVAKESGQAADTLNANNVAKMYARMLPGSLGRAVWLINSDVLPQLLTMTLGDNTIYVPPSEGFRNAPGGFLLGRPVIFTEHAKTLGDKGDIQLVDWGMYRTITKQGGIETATSMHLYFDAGATAFRATFRVDGQPSLQAPVSPANGSNTKSPFVTLDERA